MTCPQILFTSLSGKKNLYGAVSNQAKQFHQDALVIGTDSNPQCLAKTDVEAFIQSPPTLDWEEKDLLAFCHQNNITHVIPTRDAELEWWAFHSEKLKECGIHVMNSSHSAISTCLDKYYFYQFWNLECPLHPISTTLKPEILNAERFAVKERNGSGAESIGLNLGLDEAKSWADKLKKPIFQPFIEGKELSAETWIDAEGNCHGMLLRWRGNLVNGESHETEVFQNDSLAEKLTECLEGIEGLHGHILTQIIIDHNGTARIVEINPRLGGASPLALYAGIDSVLWFLLESTGSETMIPRNPKIKFGSKLIKENNRIQVLDPFPSRQTKSQD